MVLARDLLDLPVHTDTAAHEFDVGELQRDRSREPQAGGVQDPREIEVHATHWGIG
jgi:hypothetical protein